MEIARGDSNRKSELVLLAYVTFFFFFFGRRECYGGVDGEDLSEGDDLNIYFFIFDRVLRVKIRFGAGR